MTGHGPEPSTHDHTNASFAAEVQSNSAASKSNSSHWTSTTYSTNCGKLRVQRGDHVSTDFYERLKSERARAGQPDSHEYDVWLRETVGELIARERTSKHPGMLLGKILIGQDASISGNYRARFRQGLRHGRRADQGHKDAW